MSQWFIGTTAGNLPPSVPTSFVTDVNSPSIPIANIENVFGGTISINNNNGIQTDGSSGSNTLTVQLTNRIQGTVTTTDATPTTILSFNLGATPGVFTFQTEIACFNLTNVNGDGYSIFGTARTDGVNATLCDNPDKVINEEVNDNADATMVVSGNNVIIQAVGLPGVTHHWRALTTYMQVV